MSRLDNMIPPGEIVRWRSPPVIRPRRLLGWAAAYTAVTAVALVLYAQLVSAELVTSLGFVLAGGGLLWLVTYLAMTSAAEAAVTEAHVVWVEWAWRFDRAHGNLGLRDVRAVDLEEGARRVRLYCEGETHALELTGNPDLEAMARAIARPARLWRKSRSPAARRAWRWQNRLVMGLSVATIAGMVGLNYLAILVAGNDDAGRVVGGVAAGFAMFLGYWAVEFGKAALPHLLVGRGLSDEDRRDFVGALTDPRWHGLNPAGREDEWPPYPRLTAWALRAAYGGAPDLGSYGPETVVPGKFPEGK